MSGFKFKIQIQSYPTPKSTALLSALDLGNQEKYLPLRVVFLAGILISGLTSAKYNTTSLFALARVMMAQPQWPANSQASLQLFKTNLLSSPLAYYFHCAMHCLNLSASATIKVSAMQNGENVAQKMVKT